MANKLLTADEMSASMMRIFDKACVDAGLNEQEKAEAFSVACEWLSGLLFKGPPD